MDTVNRLEIHSNASETRQTTTVSDWNQQESIHNLLKPDSYKCSVNTEFPISGIGQSTNLS